MSHVMTQFDMERHLTKQRNFGRSSFLLDIAVWSVTITFRLE
jgi:hypothetical protein